MKFKVSDRVGQPIEELGPLLGRTRLRSAESHREALKDVKPAFAQVRQRVSAISVDRR